MGAQPASTTLHMTEQDYLARYADERPSYEFVNGEVTQKPMTKRSHTRLAEELLFRLGTYWRSRGGGRSGPEPTVNLSQLQDRRYRVPDLAYWAVGRPETDGEIFLPPTLAIEIQSPGQTLTLLRSKCREYRARGVDAAWLVLPSRRVVEVFDSQHHGVALGTSDKLTAAELPGFAVDLAELFAVLD